MSWLLVAFVPGLLMLAAIGLERLETGLRDETASPAAERAGLDGPLLLENDPPPWAYAFTCESAVSRN